MKKLSLFLNKILKNKIKSCIMNLEDFIDVKRL